jgi:NhaA family Na+:H+ antiporter
MTRLANSTVSLAERLEHKLHPLTGFAIVPLFALANAGVTLDAHALDAPGTAAVAAGVAAGLVVGKLVGVTGFAWLSVRAGVGRLPSGLRWSQVVGVAAVAGIGFTVSLFIAGLAFGDPGLQSAAKLGTLGGSVLASVLGAAWLTLTAADPTSPDPG